MDFGEAIRHVQRMREDPSTHIAAAIEGWKYPISRESLILADLFDLEHAKAGVKGRRDPYPRPFEIDNNEARKIGDAGGRTDEEIRAILRAHGHNLPDPD